jgi:hypothetical protein
VNGLPPELKGHLLAAMRREPSPTRAEGRSRHWLWLGVGFVLLAATSLMHGIPRPSAERPGVYLVVFGLSLLAVALPAATWVLSYTRRPRVVLRTIALAVPVLLTVEAILAARLAPTAREMGWDAHSMCLLVYALLSSLLLSIGLLGIRPLDPVAPTTAGAALGAAVGAWVTLAVSLQCPAADPFHVVVSHVAPILALTSLGAALGGRLLAHRGSN